MPVQNYGDRKAIVLSWDPGEYEGPVSIETANVADLSDVSSTELVSNQGHAAVSFPNEYSGSFTARVLDQDGNVLDEGEVDVA